MANPSQVGQFRRESAAANPFESGVSPSPSRTDSEPPSLRAADASPLGSGSGLKATAKGATDAIRQQAAQFAEEVGHELGSTAESQKARGVDALRRVARAIDSAASELAGQSPTIAQPIRDAARRVDELSDNLSKRDVSELVDSATRLARTQPILFLGGSVAAGFALGRFLKSSRPRSNGNAEPMRYSTQD